MMGGIKAQYDCIKVLSETEFFDDLKAIEVPVLVLHGEDDQICPFLTTGARSVKLFEARQVEVLPWISTRHADNACRPDQRRHPRILERESAGC